MTARPSNERRTVVCRNPKPGAKSRPGESPPMCNGGGWWGDTVPARCPRCAGPLTDLAPTMVIQLRVAS